MLDVQSPKNNEKLSGVLFPVFSMRRSGDLGIGDTQSVRLCIDWLNNYGVGFLQLLPINVSGSDHSPYSAISSIALDFIYLDVLQIPEVKVADVEKVQNESASGWLSAGKVDYVKVKEVKSRLLRAGYASFLDAGEEPESFKNFKAEEAEWLVSYCKYRWLMEEAEGEEDWTTWAHEYNSAEKALIYEAEKNLRCDGEPRRIQDYYAWVQWHAFTQWRSVRKYADRMGIKLMGDVPIGVSNSSADVFFEPQWFESGWYGGAPPETVFKDDAFACKWGQNWGVPLYDWQALREDGFAWWRRRISKLTDIFNIFRVDHILGFYRIYAFPWHPKRNQEFLPLTEQEAKKRTAGELPHFYPRADDTMVNKAKNLLAGDEYIQAIMEAAADSEVVGEDLGCVPDYVRPHLLELGIAGFKVCHWERDIVGGAVMPEEHPYCSFATYTTHDHPSLSAMWEELRSNCDAGDVKSLETLKVISEFATLDIKDTEECPAYSDRIKWSLINALMRSNARYSALMINDILDSTERINIPGTKNDGNWSYRTDWKFENIPNKVVKQMEKLAMGR